MASLMVSCSNSTESESSGQNARILDDYFNTHHNNGHFSGVVHITKSDSTYYLYSKGYSDLEGQTPLDTTFRFRIGSITKPFTAALICQLHLRDKLSVNDSLKDYFPSLPEYSDITIEQLLNHTSGIPDYHYLDNWEALSKTNLEPDVLVSLCHLKLPPDFEPATQFRYSNTGYIILGLIAEQVCDTSFEAALKEYVLNPLNLKNTGVDYPRDGQYYAFGFETKANKRSLAPYIDLLQPFSSGNMYSTTADLRKFTIAVFQNQFLGTHFTEELYSASAPGYCLGWGIRKDSLGTYYGHLGAMNGYQAGLSYFPSDELIMVILSNEQNTPKYTIMSDLRRNILLGDSIYTDQLTYLQLSDDDLMNYCGEFFIKAGDTLNVWMDQSQLVVQETAQDTLDVFPVQDRKCAVEQLEFLFEYSEDFNEIRFLNSTGIVAKRIEIVE